MKLSRENIWNFSFLILCIVGCSYQVQNVVLSYFSYSTVTRSKYYSPETISYPDLHYCFLYLEDVIDWDAIIKKYGRMFSYNNYYERIKWQDVLTVKDIFDFTADLDIEECVIRDETGHIAIVANGTQCNYFNISKYVQQQSICFRISVKKQSSMSFAAIHSSINYERLMFEIWYGGKLSLTLKNRPTLSGGFFPFISRAYTPTYYKGMNEDIGVHVSCQSFNNNFLGYPYDLFVCPPDGRPSTYFSCFDACLTKQTMSHWNRKPFSPFYTKPENVKLISHRMVQNESIARLIAKWSKSCHNYCIERPCKYSYCITLGMARLLKDIKRASYIRVESNPYPNIYINYVASLPFLDFIIYVFSSLGTWFGFVIIQCNPIAIFKLSYSSILDRMKKAQDMNIFANTFNRMNRRLNRRDLVMRRMRMRVRFYQQYYRQRRQNGE